ncbi:MAG: SDR family oxidoreductase [Verrucomicrobia bacterium]|nr:SDR family oxidoreductase [Verrucomicrobiota bacterium]
MKVLLTGANGYIGTRQLPLLMEEGHEVYALVRSRYRIEIPKKFQSQIHIIEADLLNPSSLLKIPDDIDAAYYLVHSMSYSQKFAELETLSAKNFVNRLDNTQAKQIIYLGGLSNEEHLSRHLTSRKKVGEILKMGKVPVTVLMAGIIIGSGSASFEIIRDLVEKLPVMIAPKWLNHLTQPIAVRDVLAYLTLILGNPLCFNQSFEIGGPDVMSYKELLLRFAQIRGLRRKIYTVPVLTPRLSSYWLFFVTSTSFSLARFLVESLTNNAICKENRIRELFPRELLSYEEAVKLAFTRTEQDWVPSSWKDTLSGSTLNPDLSMYIQVPRYGILKDERKISFSCPVERVQKRIWSLGGAKGWLTMDWAWKVRGFLDKLVGGIGLRRGRTHPTRLKAGDVLDFWRVLLADEKNRRLLLYAEMKLPGEAWLEFQIIPHEVGGDLKQTATFRPNGVLGRVYWYILYPFHALIFSRLARRIAKGDSACTI